MLTIICGEDSTASRDYYFDLKKKYSENYEIIEVDVNSLENINSWMGQSMSLFASKKVFFTQNINKKLSRKLNLKINNVVGKLIKNKKIEVIDWEEEISSRMLKFPKGFLVKEFKPPENIFKLQDSLYPGNLKTFIFLMNQLVATVDENFIFIMLARHIRNLLLVKTDESNSKLQPWQLYKLKGQASKWDFKKLVNFYDAFHRLDITQKTSSSPYNLAKSLDILVSYFL